LSTGDLLRDAVKKNTELGQKAKAFMDKGELVPDDLVIGVVKEQIQQPDLKVKGWILDGFPRTKVQAEALTAAGVTPDKIIFLDVPDSILVERVCGRRSDPQTGAIYHVKYNPPPPEVAARCITRTDDTEEKLKPRLTAYHANNKTILDYYQGSVIVERMDGTKTPDEVYANVRKCILTKLVASGSSQAAPATTPKSAKPKPVYVDYDPEEDDDEEEEQNSGDDYQDAGGEAEDDDDIEEDVDEGREDD